MKISIRALISLVAPMYGELGGFFRDAGADIESVEFELTEELLLAVAHRIDQVSQSIAPEGALNLFGELKTFEQFKQERMDCDAMMDALRKIAKAFGLSVSASTGEMYP